MKSPNDREKKTKWKKKKNKLKDRVGLKFILHDEFFN